MRVCIIVDNLNKTAGWGRLASKLADGMRTEGHEVGFIVSNNTHFGDAIRVHMRGLSLKKPWQHLISLYRLRKHIADYDVVICFDANPYGIFTSIATLGLSTRYFLYCIGTYSLLTKKVIKNLLIKFAYYRAEKKIVVGKFVLDQIKKSGITVENSVILPVGVDEKFFYKVQKRSSLVKRRYIISVGGIKYRKGFHLSIEAFGKISKLYPDLDYIIIGQVDDEAYFQSLVSRISELNLVDRVMFLGVVSDEDLRSLYSFAEFFLLTPITNDEAFEGFGMVYLESSMCGIPSIGSTNSGAIEAIVDHKTGLLIDPVPDEISKAIRYMLDEKEIRDEYANNALLRSINFSWTNIYRILNGILNN